MDPSVLAENNLFISVFFSSYVCVRVLLACLSECEFKEKKRRLWWFLVSVFVLWAVCLNREMAIEGKHYDYDENRLSSLLPEVTSLTVS